MLVQVAQLVKNQPGLMCVCTHLSYISHCVRVLCAGDVPLKSPAIHLMTPGAWVFIRYRTTQRDSLAGYGWRRVHVRRAGHVSETAYSNNQDPTMDGWWCAAPPHISVLKFFLRIRILEVYRVVEE